MQVFVCQMVNYKCGWFVKEKWVWSLVKRVLLHAHLSYNLTLNFNIFSPKLMTRQE